MKQKLIALHEFRLLAVVFMLTSSFISRNQSDQHSCSTIVSSVERTYMLSMSLARSEAISIQNTPFH